MGQQEYDLILSEEEMKKTKKDMETTMKHVHKKINTYIEIVDDVLAQSIVNGKIHDNMKVYLESVKKLKGIVQEDIMKDMNKETTAYPKDFDEADNILF